MDCLFDGHALDFHRITSSGNCCPKLGQSTRSPIFLNEGSEFHAEIGHIKLNWWDALELRDVKILDYQDSTMISAEALLIDFKISSLIPFWTAHLSIRFESRKLRSIY